MALLLVLLACPISSALAQTNEMRYGPKVSITAFTGVRAPYGANVVSVYLPQDAFSVRQERSGGALLGMDARVTLRGPIGLIAGGAYSRSGEARYFLNDSTTSERGPDWIAHSDDAMWFGRVGLAARFENPPSITDTRPRPSTDLIVGIGAVREFRDYHPAANFGFQGTLPIGRKLDFSLGLEDYFVFWRKDEITPVVTGIVQAFQDDDVDAVVLRYDTSNLLQLRVGFTLRP